MRALALQCLTGADLSGSGSPSTTASCIKDRKAFDCRAVSMGKNRNTADICRSSAEIFHDQLRRYTV